MTEDQLNKEIAELHEKGIVLHLMKSARMIEDSIEDCDELSDIKRMLSDHRLMISHYIHYIYGMQNHMVKMAKRIPQG